MTVCNLRLKEKHYGYCNEPATVRFGPGVKEEGRHVHYRCADHEGDQGCCVAYKLESVEAEVEMPAGATIKGESLVPNTATPIRPSWDEYFMNIARAVAQRSSCSRASVGCVIVDAQRRIIATGYNGARPGARHCDHSDTKLYHTSGSPEVNPTDMRWDDSNKRFTCAIAQHAERNALDFLISHPVGAMRLNNLTLYTTHSPCFDCASYIEELNSQGGLPLIGRVVYGANYNLSHTVKLVLDKVNLEPLL